MTINPHAWNVSRNLAPTDRDDGEVFDRQSEEYLIYRWSRRSLPPRQNRPRCLCIWLRCAAMEPQTADRWEAARQHWCCLENTVIMVKCIVGALFEDFNSNNKHRYIWHLKPTQLSLSVLFNNSYPWSWLWDRDTALHCCRCNKNTVALRCCQLCLMNQWKVRVKIVPPNSFHWIIQASILNPKSKYFNQFSTHLRYSQSEVT